MINYKTISISFSLLLLFFGFRSQSQTVFNVSSQVSFNAALDRANDGDSIIWAIGTYPDIFMDIEKDNVVITAEIQGQVIFNGSSRAEIKGDDITFCGFQYIGGNIGTNDVIEIEGNNILFTQVNITEYTSYKYLIVDDESTFVTISHCNFENRLNLDDQNILSILVGSEPGFHKIQYCSFKNFNGTGNDLGIEPIRIGVSSTANFESRTIVEFCYFTNCNGDGELISYKGAQNIIRYNTFENNPVSELVLRNSDEAIVYGNFFINNLGGIRIREGQDHFVFNNYFQDLDRRAIYLQNDPSDPLDNIHIYFNTIVNSGEVRLGGEGDNPPKNVYFANNIFSNTSNDLFEDETGTENWLGNISFGSLGITRPVGLENVNPQLVENEFGYFQLSANSPAIDAGVGGFPDILTFDGLDFDNELLFDHLAEERAILVEDKDVGALEYSENKVVQPLANEENTGPYYLSDLQLVEIEVIESNGGDVIINPNQQLYQVGATVMAKADADNGFEFASWAEDLSGDRISQFFQVDQNSTIQAIFESGGLVTNVDELIKKYGIKIYPNPSNDILFINTEELIFKELNVEVFSINGNKILIDSNEIETNLGNRSFSININGLLPGVYFIKLNIDLNQNRPQESIILKFIKE